MHGDGVFTISDVWLMVKYVYFAPGDLLILSLMAENPKFAAFLELDASSLYGWKSGVISGIAWLIALSAVRAIASAMGEKSNRYAMREKHGANGDGTSRDSRLPPPQSSKS
jgi:hypothetical protein